MSSSTLMFYLFGFVYVWETFRILRFAAAGENSVLQAVTAGNEVGVRLHY